MATNFTNAKVDLVGNTRTLLYTAPAGTQAAAHGLFITNIDDGGSGTHSITIEIQDTSSGYHKVANKIPVPYGSAFAIDKPIVLLPGEKIYLTGSTTAMLAACVSVLEKTA